MSETIASRSWTVGKQIRNVRLLLVRDGLGVMCSDMRLQRLWLREPRSYAQERSVGILLPVHFGYDYSLVVEGFREAPHR